MAGCSISVGYSSFGKASFGSSPRNQLFIKISFAIVSQLSWGLGAIGSASDSRSEG